MSQSNTKITQVGIIGADNTVKQFDIQVKAENIIGNVANAEKANRLEINNAGSNIKPIYFVDGKPEQCNYTLESNVPQNANFNDTTYNVVDETAAGLMSPDMLKKLEDAHQLAISTMPLATNTTPGMVTVGSGLTVVQANNGLLSLSDDTQRAINKINEIYDRKATDTILGMVKIGNGIKINDDGQISVPTYDVVDAKNNGLMSSDMLKSLTDIQTSQTTFNTFISNTNSSLERMNQNIQDRPTNATLTADINTLRTEVSGALSTAVQELNEKIEGNNNNLYSNVTLNITPDSSLVYNNNRIDLCNITINNPGLTLVFSNCEINNCELILTTSANIIFNNCTFNSFNINDISTASRIQTTNIYIKEMFDTKSTIELHGCRFLDMVGDTGDTSHSITVVSHNIYIDTNNRDNADITIKATNNSAETNNGVYCTKGSFTKSSLNWNNKITALNN